MSGDSLLPGSTIGIVGGGQLGRMLAAVAARMGYHTVVLAPEERPPAAAFATRHQRAAFDDGDALRRLAAEVDVVTFEFENVSSVALEAATEVGQVRPGPQVLHTTQDRAREKAFLARHDFPHAANRLVPRGGDLRAAIRAVGAPCVIKTAGFGYDGKGQQLVTAEDDAAAMETAAELAKSGPVVVERFVDLACELSVVAARDGNGNCAAYAPFVNRHVNHVLDLTLTPNLAAATSHSDDGLVLELADAVAVQARQTAFEIMEGLQLVGLCCVEFFLAHSGELLVNEIAPRPHNSGHLTIEAATTSQFEQQLRAVCGLPLGNTELNKPAAMANLLGDLWPTDFSGALATAGVALHLYGKAEPRPGRKMGHLTALGATPAEAVARVSAARAALS